MKIAILSDIHGNIPALEVVLADIDAWKPDHVIVNGDTINRGPQPRQAWALIAERITQQGWHHTMGNHEQYTLAWRNPSQTMSDVDYARYKTSLWTYEQLDPAAIGQIAQLPHSVTIDAPDGSHLIATHASLTHTRDGMQPWTPSERVREKIGTGASVFVTSHTHRFFQRSLDQTLIVNSGSVGVPLDGYPLTGYAQIKWEKQGGWSADLIRLPYDRAETRRHFRESGFLEKGGPSAYLLFKEWDHARGYVPFWHKQYDEPIRAGTITPWESVHAYLASLWIE